jgi:hypothetical protein
MSKVLDEDIMSLPPMNDSKTAHAIDVFSDLAAMTFERNENLSVVCLCRIAELILEWGLAPKSAVAFGQISIYFVRQGDLETSLRFSILAKEVLTKSQGQLHRARAHFFANVVRLAREPYSRTLDDYMECYRIGMKSGDIWFAFAVSRYFWYVLFGVGERASSPVLLL